jgi:hypothetical protein
VEVARVVEAVVNRRMAMREAHLRVARLIETSLGDGWPYNEPPGTFEDEGHVDAVAGEIEVLMQRHWRGAGIVPSVRP